MRGFRIRKRFCGFFSRLLNRRRGDCVYRRRRLHSSDSSIFTWMRRKVAGFLNRRRGGPGYARLGPNNDEPVRVGVPKGHLAVYVGQKEDDCCRVLVPVIYFNHPLFGRLLSDAEDKFGFEYPGRITIPCPVSEFQSVTTRIEAAVRRRPAGARR